MSQDVDFLMRGGLVMGPLFFCALVSVAVCIERFLVIGVASRSSDGLMRRVGELLKDGQSADALRFCEQWPGRAASVVAAGIRTASLGMAQMERAMEAAARRELATLSLRLGVLDTIITLAPLLGLLGTVTGMIRAFQIVGSGAYSSPTAITGGVSEALIATSAGLTIAIVTLPAYNFLTERVKETLGEMELRSTQLLNMAAGAIPSLEQAAPLPRRRLIVPPMKRARIEIIPMIDTIFFLLVFFMITSLSMVPMSAHKVQLPVSETASLKPSEKIVVTIAENGDYYIDREPVAENQIAPRVAARVGADPNVAVVINCDKTQTLSRLARAFDLIKQANAAHVLIATEPDAGKGQSR